MSESGTDEEWSILSSDSPDDQPFTDEELGDMAMAADPDQPVPSDAVPISFYLGSALASLPNWYMPPATARVGSRWRIAIVIAIVMALVMIDAWGYCSTYGTVTPA